MTKKNPIFLLLIQRGKQFITIIIIIIIKSFNLRKLQNFNSTSRERASRFIGYFLRNIASICNRDEDLVIKLVEIQGDGSSCSHGVAKFHFLRANNRWNLESIPLWSSRNALEPRVTRLGSEARRISRSRTADRRARVAVSSSNR